MAGTVELTISENNDYHDFIVDYTRLVGIMTVKELVEFFIRKKKDKRKSFCEGTVYKQPRDVDYLVDLLKLFKRKGHGIEVFDNQWNKRMLMTSGLKAVVDDFEWRKDEAEHSKYKPIEIVVPWRRCL